MQKPYTCHHFIGKQSANYSFNMIFSYFLTHSSPHGTHSTTITINSLLFPTTPRSRNPTNTSFKRSNLSDLYPACSSFLNPQIILSSNPRNPHQNPVFLTHCSTKPTISDDKVNVIEDQDSIISSDSNLNIQNSQKPNSNQEKSPSNTSVSRGLVLDLGLESSWDSFQIGSSVVKRFLSDEEERWYMWYHGRSRGNLDTPSIGLAVSSNGIHWERGKGVVQSGSDVGLVLKSSTDWWAFDTNGVMPGESMVMSSSKIRASNVVYWLYYTGFSNEKIEFLENPLELSLENPKNGFLFVVLILLVVVCAEVSLVLTYMHLCVEDWKWWWKSFFASGSVALYIFLYSINYLIFDLKSLSGPVSATLYLGYSLLMVLAVMLATGTVGFLSSFWFVHYLFSSVKLD